MNLRDLYEITLYDYMGTTTNSSEREFVYEELNYLYDKLIKDGFSKIELLTMKEKIIDNFEYDKMLEEIFYEKSFDVQF